MKPLSSLVSLQLLATAVRHASLTKAAQSLGMTQSAASRRISQLEADLGVTLLERHRRGVRPTPAGEAYLAAIVPALHQIAAANDQLRAATETEPLRLRVYSTFAMKWLLPRLPQFHALHPGVEVRLDTTVTPVVFERDHVDLAIQFGDGRWADADAQLLFPDLIEPVCTPAYAQRHRLAPGCGIGRGIRLLDSHYRRSDWDDWARLGGISIAGTTHIEFPTSLLAYQAAIEGLGLAMGQTWLLAAEFNSGVLVAPLARPVIRKLGHYLVVPKHRAEPRHARLFRAWLATMVRHDQSPA